MNLCAKHIINTLAVVGQCWIGFTITTNIEVNQLDIIMTIFPPYPYM